MICRPTLLLFALLELQATALAVHPHPTVLLTDAGPSPLPVVRVVQTDPVVVIEGKERRIRQRPTYFAERAPYFAEGAVTFASISLNGHALKYVQRYDDEPSASTPVVGGGYYFEARVTPAIDLKGGFIAVVLFQRAFLLGATDKPQATILVQSLPDLPAHKETTVRFREKIDQRPGGDTYFPLIFAAGGQEVRSNVSDLSARYFRRVEEVRLATVLADYRVKFPTADRPAEPVLRIQPLLPTGVAVPTEPVLTVVSIDATGQVSDVQIPELVSPQLTAALRDALGGWLFLPRLKAGEPVGTRLQVPLRF